MADSEERRLIRVLVVEDSAVVRDLLLHILSSDPEVQVVATASNGEEALQAVERSRPDVITMDIHMPKMDGFDATRRIMERRPTPIVIVSGTPDIGETVMAFRAVEAGALAVLPRSAGIGHPEHEAAASELVRTIKLMSEVKVVRRWARARPEYAMPPVTAGPRTSAAGILIADNLGCIDWATSGSPRIIRDRSSPQRTRRRSPSTYPESVSLPPPIDEPRSPQNGTTECAAETSSVVLA